MADKQVHDFNALVVQLQFWRNQVRIFWETAFCEPDTCCGSGLKVFNVDGTVMPCQWLYQFSWNRSGLKNPFDYNWVAFKPNEVVQMAYLEETLKILDAQVELYRIDEETRSTDLFEAFDTFIETLRRFYRSLIDNGTTRD